MDRVFVENPKLHNPQFMYCGIFVRCRLIATSRGVSCTLIGRFCTHLICMYLSLSIRDYPVPSVNRNCRITILEIEAVILVI